MKAVPSIITATLVFLLYSCSTIPPRKPSHDDLAKAHIILAKLPADDSPARLSLHYWAHAATGSGEAPRIAALLARMPEARLTPASLKLVAARRPQIGISLCAVMMIEGPADKTIKGKDGGLIFRYESDSYFKEYIFAKSTQLIAYRTAPR